ncbi:MAG: hypothetical protein JW969_08875, partial [Spirochaetales bacterium]|nr:hypothetical protein [Spirochaetales bacterium]
KFLENQVRNVGSIDGEDLSNFVATIVARLSGDPNWVSKAVKGQYMFTDQVFVNSLIFLRKMITDKVLTVYLIPDALHKFSLGKSIFMVKGHEATGSLSSGMGINMLVLPQIPGENVNMAGSATGKDSVGLGLTAAGQADPSVRDAVLHFIQYFYSEAETTQRLQQHNIMAPIIKNYIPPDNLPPLIQQKLNLAFSTTVITDTLTSYLSDDINQLVYYRLVDLVMGGITAEEAATAIKNSLTGSTVTEETSVPTAAPTPVPATAPPADTPTNTPTDTPTFTKTHTATSTATHTFTEKPTPTHTLTVKPTPAPAPTATKEAAVKPRPTLKPIITEQMGLINNPQFTGLKGWEKLTKGRGRMTIIPTKQYLEIRRSGAGKEKGICGVVQTINSPVKFPVILTVSLMITNQSLAGGGEKGTEYPACVQVTYLDKNKAEKTMERVYYNRQKPSKWPIDPEAKLIDRNKWENVKIEINDAREIREIRLFGSGLDFTVRFKDLKMK